MKIIDDSEFYWDEQFIDLEDQTEELDYYSDSNLVLRGELSSEVGEIEHSVEMELVEEFEDECDETFREAA